MKAIVAPTFIALAFLAGVPDVSAAPRQTPSFDSVRAQDAVRVDIAGGDQLLVDVSGPEAARVRTEVDGHTLVISEINRPWFGHDRALAATIRITMPRVAGIASSKGATVLADNIQGGDISLAASMGGELKATGACRNANVSASMGGIVRAEALQCSHATVAASMGGEVRVFASAAYDASASMGGEVRVAGGGTRGRVATSFGGEVTDE